jgi:hypothetical protein
MYQGKIVHTVREAQSSVAPPIPPLYHWLGADAEGVIEEVPSESVAIPFYHWLGANAEKAASQAAG